MLQTNFITAGKAIFTVSNPTGTHYTYLIQKKEANNGYAESYFAKLLTGPDNTSHYTYIGTLDPTQGEVRTTAKSKIQRDDQPFRVLNWALKKIWANAELPEGYKIQPSEACARCGRALTTPESLERGLGPECATRV